MKNRATFFGWTAMVVVVTALFAPSVVSFAADAKTEPEPQADDAAAVCGALLDVISPPTPGR